MTGAFAPVAGVETGVTGVLVLELEATLPVPVCIDDVAITDVFGLLEAALPPSPLPSPPPQADSKTATITAGEIDFVDRGIRMTPGLLKRERPLRHGCSSQGHLRLQTYR